MQPLAVQLAPQAASQAAAAAHRPHSGRDSTQGSDRAQVAWRTRSLSEVDLVDLCLALRV